MLKPEIYCLLGDIQLLQDHPDQATFKAIQRQDLTWKEAIQSGQVKLEGDPKTLLTFGQLFEPFELWFNMVSP